MGKKNKPVFNGYACFMFEFEKKTGQKFNSKKELAEAAASHWAELTPQQQKVYKDKARGQKDDVRYTSQGVKLDVVLAEENQKKQKEQEMNDYINSLMTLLSESNEFPFHMFYIVSINDFCFCNGNKRFIPAEISVVKFNLQDGVIDDNVFHYVIKPGQLPLGYTAEASRISKDTHQLPVPLNLNKVEDNRQEVTERLLKFLRADISAVENNFPPLFCENKFREKVENVIRYLLRDQGYGDDIIKIYSLDSLFYQLRNASADGEIIWPSITLSTFELERDIYDYCPGIACDFHDNTDVPNFCTRSKVIRLTYLICKNCCPSLNITLIPGHHIPAKATTVEATVLQNDSLSASSEARGSSAGLRRNFNSLRSESEASFHTDFTYDGEDDNASFSEVDYHLSQSSQSSSWIPVNSRRPRRDMTYENSDPVTNLSGLTQVESLTYSSTVTSSNGVQPIRRPNVPSAALGKEFSQMSLSNSQRLSGPGSACSVPISRGRGRGALAKLKQQN